MPTGVFTVVNMMRVLLAFSAAIIAGMLAFAAPAAADQAQYLSIVQPKFVFLTERQLLSEGNRACTASKNGMIAPDVVTMVQNDLKVATAVASDIVGAAVVYYGC
ncbi:MAG TPA: DUF732 domain-containing protein [Mycobacterium sp.]|nr:DUF732 domain-containing protein [Mycobacterium sp.]